MTEAMIQTRLLDLLEGLEPHIETTSLLVNDYRQPQVTSRSSAPWLIIESGDSVGMVMTTWSTPEYTYRPYITLLDYINGRSEKEALDAFQELRDRLLAIVASSGWIQDAQAASPIIPYGTEQGEEDPDSLSQRFSITVKEY